MHRPGIAISRRTPAQIPFIKVICYISFILLQYRVKLGPNYRVRHLVPIVYDIKMLLRSITKYKIVNNKYACGNNSMPTVPIAHCQYNQ